MNSGSQSGAFRNVRPVIGRDFGEAMRILWPEPVANELIRVFRHTLDTGEPYYSPGLTGPRRDVEVVESYEWELHRITLADGKYGVVCYYFDSTPLRQAQESLRESEERFRLAVEAAPNAMIMVDQEGKILLSNAQTAGLFGYAPEELWVNRSRFWSQHGTAFSILRTGRAFWRSASPSDGCGPRSVWVAEGRGEFPVEIGLSPIKTPEGYWVLSAVVDITGKRLERGCAGSSVVASSDDAIIGGRWTTITGWNRGAAKSLATQPMRWSAKMSQSWRTDCEHSQRDHRESSAG
jgi:PAS domain-containing protein